MEQNAKNVLEWNSYGTKCENVLEWNKMEQNAKNVLEWNTLCEWNKKRKMFSSGTQWNRFKKMTPSGTQGEDGGVYLGNQGGSGAGKNQGCWEGQGGLADTKPRDLERSREQNFFDRTYTRESRK